MLRRVVEKALSLLPYRDAAVTTPIDLTAPGKVLDVEIVGDETASNEATSFMMLIYLFARAASLVSPSLDRAQLSASPLCRRS